MDNAVLFNETVKRGLWVSEPGPLQRRWIVCDINGEAVAMAQSLPVALAVAYGKVAKGIERENAAGDRGIKIL